MLLNKIIILALVYFMSNVLDFAESRAQLTEQESRAILKLRDLASEELSRMEKFNPEEYSHIYYRTDDYLVKWLRARDLNVNEAFKMFQTAMKWRLDNKIDSILNEPGFNFKIPPYSYGGVDKTGRPLLIFTPLHVDLRKFLLGRSRKEALRLFDQMLEKGHQIIKNMITNNTLSDEVPKFMVVGDGNGFNLRQHFCIQLPRLAIPLLDLIRPLLSKESREALVTFSTHKPEWSKYLLSVVSADQLPYRFGGTRTA